MKKTPHPSFRLAKDTPKILDLFLFSEFYRLLESDLSAEQAAKSMGIQKSALYRKLDEIERKVCPGRQLVSRTSGRKAERTAEGDRFFHQLEKNLLPLYESTIAQYRFARPRVVIGATNAIITYLLPMSLKYTDFLRRHPDIDIEVKEGEWWKILQDLRTGGIDFGIGPGVPVGSLYEMDKLRLVLDRAIFFHPDHAIFRDVSEKKRFDLARLAEETVLAVPEWLMPDFALDTILPTPRPGVGRRLFLPHFAQVGVWCKHDLGVGIGHKQHFIPGDENDLLRSVVVDELGKTPIYLYRRSNGNGLSEVAELVAGAIREAMIAAHSDWPSFVAHFTSRRSGGSFSRPMNSDRPKRKRS